jgi:hypothetical protein
MSDSGNGDTTAAGKDDDATTSATDDSSVGIGHQMNDDQSDASLQDAHNPETEEDTTSGGPAD